MSLNIAFIAKLGKIEHEIPVWQTPTEVTMQIKKAKNPVEAYIEWVLKTTPKYNMDIAQEHIKNFKKQIKDFQDEGFQIVTEIQ